MPLAPDVDLQEIAEHSHGFVGADLEALCQEIGMITLRRFLAAGDRRGAAIDESADLGILGSCRITVVAAGVKSILDIGATLERLETLGVTVLVFGTNRFPAFWLTDSGYTVDFSVTTPEEIAEVMQAADALALPGGILVANPLPEAAQLDPAMHDRLLADALDAAEAASVRGKEITPFLLDYMHEHTDRTSVAVNLEIVRGNCKLGAEIARSWSSLLAPP